MMKNTVTRACAWVSLALFAFAPLATAQTMEVFTGAARFVDVAGTSVSITPQAMAVGGPDTLYVSDLNGRLLRLNTVSGTVTALPATSNGLNFNLSSPNAIATDSTGTLYAAALGALFRVDPDGATTNVGSMGSASQMKFAADGTLYYLEAYESRLWARLPNGQNVLIAGSTEAGFSGDGGPASAALLSNPSGITIAADGDIYIADSGNNRIRRIAAATGIITTFAGSGEYGFNGNGLSRLQTNISFPYSVAFDAGGNLFIGESSGARIRRVDAGTGLVSTYAGNGQYGAIGDGGSAVNARVAWPRSLTFDAAGDLYFGDYTGTANASHNVRRIAASTGVISRVIGNDTNYFCGEAGPIRGACLANPRGLDVDAGGDLLIADSVNLRIRRASVSTGLIDTIASPGNYSTINVEHDSNGNVYFSTWGGYYIHRIDAATGVVSIFAGNGGFSSSGDGGLATTAGVGAITDIAVDSSNNVYLADSNAGRIRKIDAATRIITNYVSGIPNVSQIDFDPNGNLVATEALGCRLRRIDKATGAITTIAGTGTCGVSQAGEGGPATAARLAQRQAFAFDPAGNIYLAIAYGGSQIRRIDAVTGIITTIPAPAGGFKTPEGIGYTEPTYMEFDAQGRLYVTDTYKNLVFRISGLLDSTPPSVEPVVVGAAGVAGWYRGDVSVSWVVTDPESGIRSRTGCTSSSVTSDTDGVTFSCSASSVGGTTSKSVIIRRDTVAPTLSFETPSPAPDASGWNLGDVTIPFTTADERSGVYTTSAASPLAITGTGPDLSTSVIVTDQAGNSATFSSPTVNIERGPPRIEYTVSGTAGNAGWYTSDVQVTWTVTGNEAPAIVTGCEPASVTTDTDGVLLTCIATTVAGTTSRSVTIKRDATPPALQWGTFSPAPNTYGWNKTNVAVPFTRADATSGIASTSAASPLTLTSEGEGVTGQVTVTDNAGNSQTFTTEPRNIDKTPPLVTITSPASGATYGFYQDVYADFDCTDVSLRSCTGTNAAGAAVNTKIAGARTFKVTAKDSVSFTTAVTNSFIVASTFNFDGFVGAAPSPAPNIVRKGSLVPLRWRLPDGHGGFVTNTASFSSIATTTVSCPGGAVAYNDAATGGSGLSFDAATDVFTYNWKSSSSFTGCKQIFITLKDGTQHDLVFKFQ